MNGNKKKNIICVSKGLVRICNLNDDNCVKCVNREYPIRVDRLTDEELLEMASSHADHQDEMGKIFHKLIDFRDNTKHSNADKTVLSSIINLLCSNTLSLCHDGTTLFYNLYVNYLIGNNDKSTEK